MTEINKHEKDLIREYSNKIKADKHNTHDVYALADLIVENTDEVLK